VNNKLSPDADHLTVGVAFSAENFTNVTGAVKRLNETCGRFGRDPLRIRAGDHERLLRMYF
jgi:hypothetical protein